MLKLLSNNTGELATFVDNFFLSPNVPRIKIEQKGFTNLALKEHTFLNTNDRPCKEDNTVDDFFQCVYEKRVVPTILGLGLNCSTIFYSRFEY